MEAKDVLYKLRTDRGLTQEEMAERLSVTRQAVSRWETGETVPNTDTLRLLSREFNFSINTLLGSPRALFCQCCGMPLQEDAVISREPDGTLNEEYCTWCYKDGAFVYDRVDDVIDACAPHMAAMNPAVSEAEVRQALSKSLPTLNHWK